MEEEEEEIDVSQAAARADNIENGTVTIPAVSEAQEIPTDRTSLIKRDLSKASVRRRPRRTSSAVGEPHGDATVTQAVLMVRSPNIIVRR